MLELKDISFYYQKDKWIIKNLSWSLKEDRRRFAVVGENGSGKSTLLKIMSKILQPKTGKINLRGREFSSLSNRELSKIIGYLGPSTQLDLNLPVIELVKFGRYPYVSFMAPLSKSDLRVIDWAIDITDLSAFKNKYLSQLSSGEKQRARLARVLAQDTDYLLLDEPTTFLDPRHWVKLLEVLWEVSKYRYIIVASHDLSFLRLFAEHILCLKEGKIIYDGSPQDFWDTDSFVKAFGVSQEKLKEGLKPE